jgi:hypothetical protein
MLFYDRACLHMSTAACTRSLLDHFNWKLFDHPTYNLDLTPSDYHLFTCPNNWLGSQCFSNNDELMEGVRTWLRLQVADLFDTGIQKLLP